MTTITAFTWQDLVEGDFVGRDVLISPKFGSTSHQLRGPIKRLQIIEKPNNRIAKYKFLLVEFEWLAYCRNENEPWIFFEDFTYPLCYEQTIDYTKGPDVYPHIICWGVSKHFKMLSAGSTLARSNVLTEYHVEVHIRHSLYPPFPRDFQLFGACHNVVPQEPEKQEDVTVAAISFAVPAVSFETAKAWCQAECERHGLPVISMKKTKLLPGL